MEVVVDEWKAEAQNGKAQDGTYGPPYHPYTKYYRT